MLRNQVFQHIIYILQILDSLSRPSIPRLFGASPENVKFGA